MIELDNARSDDLHSLEPAYRPPFLERFARGMYGIEVITGAQVLRGAVGDVLHNNAQLLSDVGNIGILAATGTMLALTVGQSNPTESGSAHPLIEVVDITE